jgi:hypothetical protein
MQYGLEIEAALRTMWNSGGCTFVLFVTACALAASHWLRVYFDLVSLSPTLDPPVTLARQTLTSALGMILTLTRDPDSGPDLRLAAPCFIALRTRAQCSALTFASCSLQKEITIKPQSLRLSDNPVRWLYVEYVQSGCAGLTELVNNARTSLQLVASARPKSR